MKKKLLLAPLFLWGSLAASADYTDYYKVYFDGEEVQNGSTVVCSEYSESPFGNTYEANFYFVNQQEDWMPMWADLLYTGQPSKEEAQADITKWGIATLCFANAGIDGTENNCLVTPCVAIIPDSSHTNFQWQVHLAMCAADTESSYQLKTISCYGDDSDYEFMEDGEFIVTIVFSPNEAGVESNFASDNQAPVYYNLQGVRVNDPQNGIYIVKRGDKISKEVLK